MMVNGVKFAFEEAGNQVAGRGIELIVDDSGGVPDKAIDKARKLVEHDKVAMIIGPMTGGEEMAVANYMTKVGVPLLVSNPCAWGGNPVEVGYYDWRVRTSANLPYGSLRL